MSQDNDNKPDRLVGALVWILFFMVTLMGYMVLVKGTK